MTLQTIRDYHEQHHYCLCPHSAVGVNVIHQLHLVSTATVCLATAHHAKFPDAVQRALSTSKDKDKPLVPPSPQALSDLQHLPTRVTALDKDLTVVQQFVRDCVFGKNKSKTMMTWWSSSSDSTKKWILVTAVVAGVVAIGMQVMAKQRR